MSKTNIGIIGLGSVAQVVHLPILLRLGDVNISAVAELDKNRLNTVSDKFKIDSRYRDYKNMLMDKDLEAIVLATPTNTHRDIAIECLKAGKDVLIEKPVAINYKEAKEIYETAKKNKCKVMVGMNLRHRPDAMLLKSLISNGELGEIFYIKCGWLRKRSSSQNWSVNKKKAGGGVIIDLGIVLLDLAMWLLNNHAMKSVSVQGYNHISKNVEDSAVGFIRFKNTAVINFEVSWTLHSEVDSFNLTAFGTKGTAHLNPFRAYKRVESSLIEYAPTSKYGSQKFFQKSYENELKHFIAAVRGLTPILSSVEDSLNTMKLLEGIYKSIDKTSETTL